MAIMAAHRVPYAASLSLAHPDDMMRKMVALDTDGFRFLLLFSPCPTGWKSDPADTAELSRMAVASGLFPLYEVLGGRRYRINARPDDTPLEDYLSRQKRFPVKTLNVDALRVALAEQWAFLDAMAAAFPAGERCRRRRRWARRGRRPRRRRWRTDEVLPAILVLDRPAVLARVAGQVARRGVNIDHFTARNVKDGRTVITIGINTDGHAADRLAKGVARLINVLEVTRRDGDCPEVGAAMPGTSQVDAKPRRQQCHATK